MVKVYTSLIKKGLRSIDTIPEKYKEDVEKLLNE